MLWYIRMGIPAGWRRRKRCNGWKRYNVAMRSARNSDILTLDLPILGPCEASDHKHFRSRIVADAQLLDVGSVGFDVPNSNVGGFTTLSALLENLLNAFQSDIVEGFHKADDVEFPAEREFLYRTHKPFSSWIIYLLRNRYCLGRYINTRILAGPGMTSETCKQVACGAPEIQETGILGNPRREKI